MNEHVTELIESMDALLHDLHTAGCQFVVVLMTPDDRAGFHSWRSGNLALLYGLLQAVEQDVYDDLIDSVRGGGGDDDA
jgi:hypothetical protein